MNRLLWFAVLALLAAAAPVFAQGQLQSMPAPPGWSPTPNGTGQYKAPPSAANEPRFAGRVVANVTAQVDGRAVTMPASMRFAANAGQIAMNAIRFNPALLVAGVAAAYVLDRQLQWSQANGWEAMAPAFEFSAFIGGQNGTSTYHLTQGGATGQAIGFHNARPDANRDNGLHPSNHWYATISEVTSFQSCGPFNAGNNSACLFRLTRTTIHPNHSPATVSVSVFNDNGFSLFRRTNPNPQPRPALDPDFDVPPGHPMPPTLPDIIPDPMPTEMPRINPGPAPDLLPQPNRIPTGQPEPQPGTNPQVWRNPYIDIIPASSNIDPWRVRLVPGFIDSPSPNPLPESGVPTQPGVVAPPSAPPAAGPPVEFNTCGLPGKPPCKIDESGTPTVAPVLPDIESILGPLDDPQTTAAPSWSWTFALPSACSVISVGEFAGHSPQLDLCQWTPMIHGIMTIVWLMGTIFACISLVGRTFQGS